MAEHLRPLCDVDDGVDERRPVDVRFDSGEENEIAVAFWEARDVDVVLGPANLSLVVFVEVDLGTFLGEVEERVGIDAADDRHDTVAHAPFDCLRCRTRDVEPAAQRDEEDGVTQRSDVVPTRGENVVRLHTPNSTSDFTHPSVRPRNRCTS